MDFILGDVLIRWAVSVVDQNDNNNRREQKENKHSDVRDPAFYSFPERARDSQLFCSVFHFFYGERMQWTVKSKAGVR